MNLVNYHGKQQLATTTSRYLCGANPNTPRLIPYGCHYIDMNDMKYHVLSLGATGTGKSLGLKSSMAHNLAYCLRGSGVKVVIFDPKGDLLPIANYFSQKNGVPLYLINIGDNRSIKPQDGVTGYAWDIGKDCGRSPSRTLEMLSILFPISDKDSPFWAQVIRLLSLAAVEGKVNFTLYNIYNLFFGSKESIDKVLERSEFGRIIKQRIFDSEAKETRDNILISGIATMMEFGAGAAHQYYTPRNRWLSLEDFVKGGEGILVFQQDLAARSASNPVIQAMFKTLMNQINTLPDLKDSDPPRIRFYIDEAPYLGKLSGLTEGLTFQRSKGVFFYIVAQEIEGLRNVYGKDITETIANNCDFKLLFRTNSAETAEWSVNLAGKERFYEDNQSFNQGQNGIWTQNISRQVVERNVFVSSDFLNLPAANKQNGIDFYFLSPYTSKRVKYNLSPQEVEDFKPPKIPCPFIPKDTKYSYMPSLEEQKKINRCSKLSGTVAKVRNDSNLLENYLTNDPHPIAKAIRMEIPKIIDQQLQAAISSLLNLTKKP